MNNYINRFQREALGLETENTDGTIFQFLQGSHSFNGLWFGDKKDGAVFWWRKELRKAIEQPLHGEEVNSDRLSVIIKGLRASVKNLSDNGISDLSIRAVEHWQNELDKFIQQTQPSKQSQQNDSELEPAEKALKAISKMPELKQFILKSDATEKYQHTIEGIRMALRDAAKKGWDTCYNRPYASYLTHENNKDKEDYLNENYPIKQ